MKNLMFSLLLIGLFATSCSKENIDEKKEIHVPTELATNLISSLNASSSFLNDGSGILLSCVNIKFPISFIQKDGEKVTVINQDDYQSSMDNAANEIIDFVFPVQTANGALDDGFSLAKEVVRCAPAFGTLEKSPAYLIDGTNSCFSMSYPIELESESGDKVEAKDESEYINMLLKEPNYFSFPLTLLNLDGTSVSVKDNDELQVVFLINC